GAAVSARLSRPTSPFLLPISHFPFSLALLLALIIVMSATVVFPARASAKTAPTVSDAGVTDSFPDGMSFAVTASSDSPINDLKIRYKILPDGTSANASSKIQPSTSVTPNSTPGAAAHSLPPGTE